MKTPVAYHHNSRSAPQDYFEAVQKEMKIRLRADMAYNHTITKNPLHPRWRTQTYPTRYDLSDFLEYIELPKDGTARALPDHIQPRANDELFHTLRLWAYGAVHACSDPSSWEMLAHVEALDINACFARPLPLPEVKATAKSVARWTWKHRHNLGNSHAKILQFTDETAEERMSMGADHTNSLRRKKSLDTLQQAVIKLTTCGEKISVSLLVKHRHEHQDRPQISSPDSSCVICRISDLSKCRILYCHNQLKNYTMYRI